MTDSDEIRPSFEKIKRDNPFQVPEGYFDTFSAKLNGRIHDDKQPAMLPGRVLLWKPFMAAAITIFVALAAGIYAYFSNSDERAAKRLYSEITQVVEQELYSISEETIFEMTEAESSTQTTEESAGEDEVINYLMNEEIQEDELLNAL